jgi:anti-anti-sigma factor
MGDSPEVCFVQVTDLKTPRPVVAVVGELNFATAPLLAKGISAALDTSPRDLILDLTETSFLGSAGISIILLARKHLHKHALVVLRHPQPFVRRMLDACQLDTLCVVED